MTSDEQTESKSEMCIHDAENGIEKEEEPTKLLSKEDCECRRDAVVLSGGTESADFMIDFLRSREMDEILRLDLRLMELWKPSEVYC